MTGNRDFTARTVEWAGRAFLDSCFNSARLKDIRNDPPKLIESSRQYLFPSMHEFIAVTVEINGQLPLTICTRYSEAHCGIYDQSLDRSTK
jgi:hypothetical protein